MTAFQMYLLLKLDDVQTMFTVLIVLIVVLLILVAFVGLVNCDDTPFPYKRCFYLAIPLLIIMGLSTITPSTKQMAVIYVTPKIMSAIDGNAELKKIPDGIISLANAWIEELKPKEKGSAKKH